MTNKDPDRACSSIVQGLGSTVALCVPCMGHQGAQKTRAVLCVLCCVLGLGLCWSVTAALCQALRLRMHRRGLAALDGPQGEQVWVDFVEFGCSLWLPGCTLFVLGLIICAGLCCCRTNVQQQAQSKGRTSTFGYYGACETGPGLCSLCTRMYQQMWPCIQQQQCTEARQEFCVFFAWCCIPVGSNDLHTDLRSL